MKIKMFNKVRFTASKIKSIKTIRENVTLKTGHPLSLRETLDLYNILVEGTAVEVGLQREFNIKNMEDIGVHLFEYKENMKKDIIKLAETCLSQNWYQVAGLLYQAAGLLGQEE